MDESKQINSGIYTESEGEGKDYLLKLKNLGKVQESPVIYGVYDNSKESFLTKVNDFLIDHSRVTLKDKSYFFHMLSMMVGAGVPVVTAVKSLANHTENPRFRRILNTVAYFSESGSTLADAMSRFDDVFEESEIGIVRAGEVSGRLNQMLFKLSGQLDKRSDLAMKLWSASIYPLAILSILILVAIGMLVYVLPTLMNLLEEGGVEAGSLPLSTTLLIGLQHALVGYWWAILLVIFSLYGMFNFYMGTPSGAMQGDYVKLKIPVVGNLIRKVYVLNFVGMLGLLIDSGLPVISALSITGNSLKNRIYKVKIKELIESVRQGGKISDGIADSEFLFPPEVTQMLRVGETSANLAQVAERVAEQYQREVDNSLKKMTAVFEPLMILFVGMFVALLAMAIMAPIFNLTTVVGN